MSSCDSIETLVTPYVDGELPSQDRQRVDAHIASCAVCRSRVEAERAVSDLVRARRGELCADRAPEGLRARCCRPAQVPHAVVPFSAVEPQRTWRQRMPTLALAAVVLLAVGGAVVYRVTVGATQAIAAELAADHLKCFLLNRVLGTHDTEAEAEAFLLSSFGWQAELPDRARDAGLELVGSRWCLYEHGRIAHVMYTHKNVPVSLFMLPGTSRERSLTRALGHDAVVWADRDRTFVLVARAPRAEVQNVVSFVQSALH
jgi:anti-sigma factor (TIGR02949 family)